MTSTAPQSVLARLPGWEDAWIQELSGGLSNRTWLVESSTSRAVLKIDDAPRGEPFNSRLEERRIQHIAATAGLANEVLFADECTYMAEYA
ncbi:MAG: phosphotransferase, partial [Woeseiaceae bacterium]